MGKVIEKMIIQRGKIGFSDLYHVNIEKRGLWGQLYLLVFGTTQLKNFSNGKYLNKFIKNKNFKSILDAGCGVGTFTFYLAKKYPKSLITGVDCSDEGLNIAKYGKQKISKYISLKNVKFNKKDLLNLSELNKYDFIICFDVLEHIKNNKKAIHNLYNSLNDSGCLMLRIPTEIQKRILTEKFTEMHSKWASHEHQGQHYNMLDLLADLRSAGFFIIDYKYTNGFWGKLSFELLEAMKYFRIPECVQFIVIPFLKIFRNIDVHLKIKNGNGILVICKKRNQQNENI